MTTKEKDTIVQIVNKILDELKVLGDSAVSGSFRDYGEHEVNIKNLLVLLKHV